MEKLQNLEGNLEEDSNVPHKILRMTFSLRIYPQRKPYNSSTLP